MNVQPAVAIDDVTKATTPALPDDHTWQMVMLSRIGKPPLRFRGRCLFARSALRDEAIRLDLWQKRVGGFVVNRTVIWRGQLVLSSSAHTMLPMVLNAGFVTRHDRCSSNVIKRRHTFDCTTCSTYLLGPSHKWLNAQQTWLKTSVSSFSIILDKQDKTAFKLNNVLEEAYVCG